MLSFADHSHKTPTFLWEDRGHRGSLSNDVLFHLTLSMYGVDTYCYTFAIYCKIVLNQFYSSFCFWLWACDTISSSLNWTWQFSNLWTWLRFGYAGLGIPPWVLSAGLFRGATRQFWAKSQAGDFGSRQLGLEVLVVMFLTIFRPTALPPSNWTDI